MRLSRAAWQAFAASCFVTWLALGCGNGSSHPDPFGTGGSAKAGSGGAAGGPHLGVVGGDGSGTGSPDDEACAGDLIEAQRLPLDMYVMLDVSGSMLAPTEGDASVTKWQAVSSALGAFVSDDASAGIGMGLQVFPIRHPDAPESCTSSSECGTFGPCFRKFCEDQPGIVVCETRQDCGLLGGNCVDFGFCENDQNILCWPPGLSCAEDDNGQPLGGCLQPPTSPCLSTADCTPATYQTPAAPIAELPAARAALLATIESAMPDPDGATPTGPALKGAIDQASAWATAHADHQVVAVLATDGLPTECTPLEIGDVAALASVARLANPSIATFVIGVVGPEDVDAPGNLHAIARAGGTERAFIVETQGDVAAQFQSALNAIRASRLSCDLLVPEAEAGKAVDYDYVNVVLDDGTGPATLDYVTDSSGCSATDGGWYFDKDPDGGAIPEHILVCPTTCEKFGKLETGSVQIELGCARREPK